MVGGGVSVMELKDSKLIVGKVEFDLTEYQGKKVTVFQEDDGSYTIESKPTHYLTICELEIPIADVRADPDANPVVEKPGEAKTEAKPLIKPLDLKLAKLTTFKEVSNAA
jgi:hypothetical protein